MENSILTQEWKDIRDYEAFYEVSNYGLVRNKKTGRILKTADAGKGYLYVNLGKCDKGKTKNFKVHRLVAEAFIPNPKNLPQINHKDLNKQNNRVDNLEWVDAYQNQRHQLKATGIEFNITNIIHSRVLQFNLKYPTQRVESARTAANKYKTTGYIPEYIYNEDLLNVHN